MAALRQKLAFLFSIGKVPPVIVDEGSGGQTIEGSGTDKFVTEVATGIVGVLAMGALVSGGLSFYFAGSNLVDLMSFIVCLLGPTLAIQKVVLKKLGSFRSCHNQLRRSINRLNDQNERMIMSVNALESQATKLDKVRKDLSAQAARAGQSVDHLVNIVEENGKIQNEIMNLLQAEVLQSIMTAILHTDSDRNFVLCADEVEILIVRLKNIPGVEFDEVSFRSLLESNQGSLCLADVCKIARNLKEDASTVVKSCQSRREIFSSPKGAFTPRNKDKQLSRTGRGAAFKFKPRSFLKVKKLLGIF